MPSPPRESSTAAVKSPRRKRRVPQAIAAAGFEWAIPGKGGLNRPVWIAPKGGLTMIDTLKGRNNYYTMNVRDQASICRRMVERNWFLRPVHALRHACTVEGFRAVAADGVSLEDQYDFASLVEDIIHEDMTTSNVVCLWRKGEELPTLTVLDAETVDYQAAGGLERITIQYAVDAVMARDKANAQVYIKALGERVYKAYTTGGKVEIIKGVDEEWDFEVMVSGKRRGVFTIPEPVPILDTVDFLELMGIGDWNLGWYRKDVIRLIKKGYPVTQGQGAGINSVDITTDDISKLGDGFSTLNGNSVVPANHDVAPSYLTVAPDNFKPDQVASAIDRIMLYGGIEAVVLLGSFSQQNGAAPSLMRNARTTAFARRMRVEKLLRRIFSAEEFSSIDWGVKKAAKDAMQPMKFEWGVKSLYSLDELLSLAKATNDGTLSTQTRRELLGFNNEQETQRHLAAHAERQGYAPAFEAGQALLPMIFPDELKPATTAPADPTTPPPAAPGRPPKTKT